MSDNDALKKTKTAGKSANGYFKSGKAYNASHGKNNLKQIDLSPSCKDNYAFKKANTAGKAATGFVKSGKAYNTHQGKNYSKQIHPSPPSKDNEALKKANGAGKVANGFVKSGKAYNAHQGKKSSIQIDSSRSCKVNLVNKVGNANPTLDSAYPKVEYKNIKPKYSKQRTQVETQPTGILTQGKTIVNVCQVSAAYDTFRIANAGYKDYQNGTTRNTVETGASVAGGLAGEFGGGVGGAVLGTAIFPGIGTIIGGLFGRLTGKITGSVASGAVVQVIGDAFDYDMEQIKCNKCCRQFKARKYDGEKYCEKCLKNSK